MSKKELQKLFPKIRVVEHTNAEGGDFEVLEIRHNVLSYVASSLIAERLWFCLYNERLIKWGKSDSLSHPDDWWRNDKLCTCETNSLSANADN